VILLFAAPTARAADCIPIHQAGQHIGETRCVTGKVFAVKVGTEGVHFLDFCEDAMACPFTVVVFSNDLKDVGDVRRLAGRTIEIRGALKAYDGRPQNHPQPHKPDRRRRCHDPSATQELRCGKSRPLQCRSTAPNEKAHHDEGQAEHHRDFWQ
jgi:hypothetical protein